MTKINRRVDKLIARRLEAYREMAASLKLDEHQKELLQNGWVNSIDIKEKLRWKNYRYSMRSLAVLVIFSALVPALINVESDDETINSAVKIVATVLSITVTILTGLRQGFKWTEKWKHYHNSAEALKSEGEMFVALAGVYAKFPSHAKAFGTFIQNSNAIKTEHLSEYIRNVSGGDQTNPNNPGNGSRGSKKDGEGGENEKPTTVDETEPRGTPPANTANQ